MSIDQNIIKEHIKKAFSKGYIQIKDHRQNVLVLNDGSFSFNGCIQPKQASAVEFIFLEAFRLSRHIKLDDIIYVRKLSKWVVEKPGNVK